MSRTTEAKPGRSKYQFFTSRISGTVPDTDEIHRVELMAQIALVGVGLLALAPLHGAMADDLATVQEHLLLDVVKLQRALEVKISLFPQALDEVGGDDAMHLAAMAQTAALIHVEADVVSVERRLLAIVVALDVVLDGPFEGAGLDFLAIPLLDGGTEAVGSRNENDVIGPDAVAQEAGVTIGGDENAADMTEMKGFVAVRHARGHDGALGPDDGLMFSARMRHVHSTPQWR